MGGDESNHLLPTRFPRLNSMAIPLSVFPIATALSHKSLSECVTSDIFDQLRQKDFFELPQYFLVLKRFFFNLPAANRILFLLII